MPVDPTSHPDYRARQAKFNADKQAAITAGDEAAQARAESEWSAALNSMTVDLYERANTERDRAAAIARIKAENPAAPEAIFVGTDLAQIESAAKAVQEVANQAAQRQGGTAGTWSPPPSGGTGTSETELRPEDMTPEQREEARQARLAEIAPTVMRKGRYGEGTLDLNEEMQRLSVQPLVERFAGRQR